ncbi:MAG: hypothetical protein AMS18_00540 [Gemmatimonas sp. SG8_17]|nr:MAG: hypothetical protein AMS18_00540 [Gemmatimonas sp. SG8_17]
MTPRPPRPGRSDRLRPLNLPQPAEVELDGQGRPTAVNSIQPPNGGTAEQREKGYGQERRAVESILEIWRVDDEWWRQPISRWYAEVVLEGGMHVTLYEDLMTGDWYIQRP